MRKYDADVARFQKIAERARSEMVAACEHYASAMQALAVALERKERAAEGPAL